MECYICLDNSEPLYKICNCNSAIHKQCLLELLKKTNHNKKCTICKDDYNIFKIKLDKGWKINTEYSIKLFVVYCIGLILIIISIIMLYFCYRIFFFSFIFIIIFRNYNTWIKTYMFM